MSQLSHDVAPILFGLRACRRKHRCHQLALTLREPIFQFATRCAEYQPLDASVQLILIGFDEPQLLQCAQWGVERLFADTQNAQQRIDTDRRIAPDEVEDPVMHPLQSLLGQDGIRAAGEGAKGEVK